MTGAALIEKADAERARAAVDAHAKRVARALELLGAVEALETTDRFEIGRDGRDAAVLATADIDSRELVAGMGSIVGALLSLGRQVRR